MSPSKKIGGRRKSSYRREYVRLEESSAERVINDVLIPNYAPDLRFRLRTYACGGVSNVEPTVADFQRLVTFIHLQPAYEGRLWIRLDGDQRGINTVAQIRGKFPYLTDETCAVFNNADFELYYPGRFDAEVARVLAIQDRQAKRSAKTALLSQVLTWTSENTEEARTAWSESAGEVIETLQTISRRLG